MNRGVILSLIILGLGIFLWFQRDEIVAPSSGSAATASAGQPIQGDQRFIIREKIKPGGYIGWHTTERDTMTSSPQQTRQASNYYFVCTEVGTGTQRIFRVSASDFNLERVGNVLSAGQVSSFREVSSIEEPALPANFEFRRREAGQ